MSNPFQNPSEDVQQYSARETLEQHRSSQLKTFAEGNRRTIYDVSQSFNASSIRSYRPQARSTAQEIEDYMRQLYHR